MLEVEELTVYRSSKCCDPIFSNLSFKIDTNQCFGIVGPSGCGKSTLLRTLASLHPYWKGKITVDTRDMRRKLFKNSLIPTCQMVFQDPLASLHPRHLVYKILREPLFIHNISHDEHTLIKALEEVCLEEKYLFRYPHELSGGQRQRVSIARSLILRPKILLLDECTSALDVSTQKQILELIKDVQKQRNMTVLMVSHCDFVIRFMCQESIDLGKNYKK